MRGRITKEERSLILHFNNNKEAYASETYATKRNYIEINILYYKKLVYCFTSFLSSS